MVSQVGNENRAIGQISASFLGNLKSIKAVTIDGQAPSTAKGAYPITRPLYLVTQGEPAGAVKEYIDWLLGPEGQKTISRLFATIR
jgi:phosphate transport system substrate-binding protein